MAALVWSRHPHCTAAEIREALQLTAQDRGPPGRDVDYGFGIVKAKNADEHLTNYGCAAAAVAPTQSLQSGVSKLLSAGMDEKLEFVLDIPTTGANTVACEIAGGSGDADLYTRWDSAVDFDNKNANAVRYMRACWKPAC